MKKNEIVLKSAKQMASESLKALRSSALSLSISAAALAASLVPLLRDSSIGVAWRGIAVTVIVISILCSVKYGREWWRLGASRSV